MSSWRWCLAICLAAFVTACCSRPPGHQRLTVDEAVARPSWIAADAELLQWHALDPHFAQTRALEGSGLAASERYLYVVAEKYAVLLLIDLQQGLQATALPLAVPAGAELEGVAWRDGTLFICDEAHAAVYAVDVDEEAIAAGRETGPLAVRELPLVGVQVQGGKVGFEGIAVAPDSQRVYLLLERSGSSRCDCHATIFPLRLDGGELHLDAEPLVIPLADCAWRLADLVLHEERLLAIQSRYPGEEYRVLAIDPESGRAHILLEITPLGRSLRPRGFGNNLEGMTVGPDGWLYMVGDNADIPRAQGRLPPLTDELTVFLRLPPAPLTGQHAVADER